jgi:hypothetical protein
MWCCLWVVISHKFYGKVSGARHIEELGIPTLRSTLQSVYNRNYTIGSDTIGRKTHEVTDRVTEEKGAGAKLRDMVTITVG